MAERTTSPSTTRLTEVSSLRTWAGSGPRTGWSKVRWPQPPVAWSLIRSRAVWPRRSETSKFFQFSRPFSSPLTVRTTSSPTSSCTARLPSVRSTAADQEAQVVVVDGELRGGQGADVVVAVRAAVAGVDPLVAEVELAAGGGRVAAGLEVAGQGPAVLGDALAARVFEPVEQQLTGRGRVAVLAAGDVGVVAAADQEVQVGLGDGEGRGLDASRAASRRRRSR